MAASTGLAYVRYQSGVDMSQFMTEEQLAQEQAQYYDQAGNYQQQQPQYNGQQQQYTMDPSQQQYTSGSYMNYDGDINMAQWAKFGQTTTTTTNPDQRFIYVLFNCKL